MGPAAFVRAAIGVGVGSWWLVRGLDFRPLYSVLAVFGALTVVYAVLSWPWRLLSRRVKIEYAADEPPDPRYALEPMDRARASPAFRELLARMARSASTGLKLRYGPDVLLRGDERSLDLLLVLAEDADTAVRDAASDALNRLAGGRVAELFGAAWRRRDAAYFRSRRADPKFVARLVRRLTEADSFKPLVV